MIPDADDPRALLGPLETPPPAADLMPRMLAAAAPLLAAHVRRTSLRALLRPLVVALLPLPAILAFDATVVAALYGLLSLVLPAAVTTYLVVQYSLFVLLLLALAYAAVPVLVDRQARATLEEVHV